ncbi:MAG: alpha/beta fold hydrolase [Lysobacterales bacterium]|nr:MAG: alpha/beta fold hydrolase [Xanthomonadales bacterium]
MEMSNMLFEFLSRDYSGLILASLLLIVLLLVLRSKPPRMLAWLLRVFAVAAFVLAVGAASHLVRLAGLTAKYPPPGKMVDVGGYRMHVFAEGPAQGPAVVWFTGGHSGSFGFYDQHKAVRDQLRSILVDRPGTGWSDTGPFPRTTARESDEIIRALEAAGERGPFIFAGHSFGGLLAANIARRYPEKTAAVALLDPTPPDVLFYGADKKGLGSFYRAEFHRGLRRLFGLYRFTPPPVPGQAPGDSTVAAAGLISLENNPIAVVSSVETRAGTSFANSSILRELSAHGLVDRAWDTMVFDGELGEMPLYLIAPGKDESIKGYTEQVLAPGPEADRFHHFLTAARERFMAASSRSKRIYAPEGTGHNFPAEAPAFVTQTVLRIARDVSGATDIDADAYAKLTTAWPGPYGGLPPVELATPLTLEAAYRKAVEEKRAEVRAIAANPAPATFENTILALEASGLALRRIEPLLRIFASTNSNEEIAAVAARIAPLGAELDDEIAHDKTLFARVEAVHAGLPESAPSQEAQRLVRVTRDNLYRGGATLGPEDKSRLAAINGRLAELQTEFNRNTVEEEATLVVFIEDASGLEGLGDAERTAAKAAAEARGRPESWAIPIARPTVWPFLTKAATRALREQVWRQWVGRGANPGDNDNRPVMAEILKLRGEKAKLLGFPTFAHYQTSARMIGTPDAALALMTRTWDLLLEPTRAEIAASQAIAEVEGADFELKPWDRLYYAEKLRQRQFNLDAEAVKPYLVLGNVVDAMFWAAGESFGFTFRELEGVPVISPDIRVFEVSLQGQVLGVLWLDLFQRQGKGPASWVAEYRSAENFRGRVLPLVGLHSAVPRPTADEPVLVPWERANVIFHEFGHALHMLSSGASYPLLGALTVPWDFIETPSLLNERWLLDRRVLKRFMRHHETGEPMPDDLIDRVERSLRHDRVFSATLNYLATAIVDMRLHLMADGREIDAMAEEQRILEELQLPPGVDLTLYVPHAFHTFSQQYAAGVYTYLWSDVIAADIAETFLAAPGGLYDRAVAGRYFSLVLSVGNTVPAAEAFRSFQGRDPDPGALTRRFGRGVDTAVAR